MKTDRILKLADLIEAGDDKLGFNMNTYGSAGGGYKDLSGHNCGTVACIAGWTVAAFGLSGRATKFNAFRAMKTNQGLSAHILSTKLLGLSGRNAAKLLAPNSVEDWNQITSTVAARCLRNLAETGEVDWEKAMEYQQ